VADMETLVTISVKILPFSSYSNVIVPLMNQKNVFGKCHQLSFLWQNKENGDIELRMPLSNIDETRLKV